MPANEILAKLAAEMPYHWRIGPVNKEKKTAQCLAYIDARDAANRLNEVLGFDWGCDYKEIWKVKYCGVGILIDSSWRWRWDAGTESNTEAEKGEASDSFKRACVKWGVGSFLYDMAPEKIDVIPSGNSWAPADPNGTRIWDLTEYINHRKKNKPAKKEEPNPAPVKPAVPVDSEEITAKKQIMLAAIVEAIGTDVDRSNTFKIQMQKFGARKMSDFLSLKIEICATVYNECLRAFEALKTE